MSDDVDELNLADLWEVRDAVDAAEALLTKVMEGAGEGERKRFVWAIEWALGRLSRIAERVCEQSGVPPP